MVQNEPEVLKKELVQRAGVIQGREEEVTRLQKVNDDVPMQLSEAQHHCQNLVAVAHGKCLGASVFHVFTLLLPPDVCDLCVVVPLPEIQNDNAEARLREVVATAEKMHGALGVAVGTLFRGDPDLRFDLETVLSLLGRSPQKMKDWLFSAAYEGARQVLAGMRAHNADMNLGPLVRSMLGDHESEHFFEEVSEDAEFAIWNLRPARNCQEATKVR